MTSTVAMSSTILSRLSAWTTARQCARSGHAGRDNEGRPRREGLRESRCLTGNERVFSGGFDLAVFSPACRKRRWACWPAALNCHCAA